MVRSRHPLWDQENGKSTEAGTVDRTARLMDALSHYPLNWRGALTTSAIDAQPQEVFRVAGPSIWPFICALGIITIFGAEIFSLRAAVVMGAVLLIGGLIGWHWPVDKVPTTDAELAFEREHGIPVRPNGSRIVSNWAMNLMILLVGIALSSLLFSYFYIRVDSTTWPPAGIPLPSLLWPAISTLLFVISGAAIWWARQGIQRDNQSQLRVGLAVGFGLGVVALAVLGYDFWQIPFSHEIHAYGSLFYTLIGFLFMIVGGGLFQNALTQIWTWKGNYSAREYVAIDVGVRYWLATIVYWLGIVATLYLSPYLW